VNSVDCVWYVIVNSSSQMAYVQYGEFDTPIGYVNPVPSWTLGVLTFAGSFTTNE
jgi:hypothetical protein